MFTFRFLSLASPAPSEFQCACYSDSAELVPSLSDLAPASTCDPCVSKTQTPAPISNQSKVPAAARYHCLNLLSTFAVSLSNFARSPLAL